MQGIDLQLENFRASHLRCGKHHDPLKCIDISSEASKRLICNGCILEEIKQSSSPGKIDPKKRIHIDEIVSGKALNEKLDIVDSNYAYAKKFNGE